MRTGKHAFDNIVLWIFKVRCPQDRDTDVAASATCPPKEVLVRPKRTKPRAAHPPPPVCDRGALCPLTWLTPGPGLRCHQKRASTCPPARRQEANRAVHSIAEFLVAPISHRTWSVWCFLPDGAVVWSRESSQVDWLLPAA